MRIDHVVVHIDNDPSYLERLKASLDSVEFPFDPTKGKGTRGFKVANIWIGDEYFELPWLKKSHGGGWQPQWVDKYNQGKRGLFCLFLEVPNLESKQTELRAKGLDLPIERTSFRVLGLFKVTMPWKYIFAPEIPGMDLQIGFFQYDAGAVEKLRAHRRPNSRQNGIEGIPCATVYLPEWKAGVRHLHTLFPDLREDGDFCDISLSGGTLRFEKAKHGSPTALLQAHSNSPALTGKRLRIEDVELTVAYRVLNAQLRREDGRS